jgi:hypothetical protein
LFLQTSVCVLGTLISHAFILCFQHLVLTHLHSFLSAPCTDTCFVRVISNHFSENFSMCSP